MRPLTLHVSALSDAEYDLFTASLDDLATDSADASSTHAPANPRGDAHYERTAVGAREARAWLRGRYAHLPASDIEAILKLFCPSMLPSDTLTGGQFFAALRLVTHAESGKGVDRTLAFVQASPAPPKALGPPRPLSPPKRTAQTPPAHPDRQKQPPLSVSSPETNPFTRRSIEHALASAPPADPESVPVLPPKRPNKLSQNPFLARDRPVDPSTAPPGASPAKLPPLPPRKPALLPPTRQPSEAQPAASTLTHPLVPPLIPVKPTHVMSPLMRQSLEASKHAQSLKRAEAQLDRERVLQVLKTTSSSSSTATTPSTRPRSLSPGKPAPSRESGPDVASGSDDATCVPPLPRRRRKPSLSASTATTSSSALSFEQVAHATLSSPVRPPLPSRDVAHAPHDALAAPGPGPIPPPTHPHRRTSTSTSEPVNDTQPPGPPSPRAGRAHTLPSAPGLPPPPPRRRRPESVHWTSPPDPARAAPPGWTHGRAPSHHGLSRHLSLSRDPVSTPAPASDSALASLQRTLTHLQLRAQPTLDAVRYKAEAGVSRRGYVPHTRWRDEGEEGLMADGDARWAAQMDRDPSDSEPTTDHDASSSGEEHDGGRRAGPYRDQLTASDNLKWPMGEGWKQL